MAHPYVSQARQFSIRAISGIACTPVQPIQSTVLNLSLDKYTPLQFSLVKVLLTVSPLGPSFQPQLDVFSRSSRPLGTDCGLIVFRRPLDSCTYKLPPPAIDLQLLCFHGLTNPFFGKPFVFTSIQIAGGVTPCSSGYATNRASGSRTGSRPCCRNRRRRPQLPARRKSCPPYTACLRR